jgi:N4-gp56 family major capsid protein
MADMVYGDITPRTAAFAASRMLKRGMPVQCMAKFGQLQPIPKGRTKVVKWRRYNKLAVATTALTEGATPSASTVTNTDVTATLAQYGDRVRLTDVILDTHEDPVLAEFSDILGEAAGETKETLLYNVLKAGTNVRYTNGAARNAVNTALTADALRLAIRSLKRQNANMITTMLAASTGVGTTPIPPCYVAFVHPDSERDLQGITGFNRVQTYGTWKPLGDNEIGSFENIRFLTSTLYAPFLDAGGAKGTMVSTTGTSADVYPALICGKDAFASVALAGADAITPMVVNPKPSDSDPLAQRGHVGYKFYHAAAILNDAFMCRLEHAVTA